MSEALSIEELVRRVQGGESELVKEIWERIKDFVHIKAKDMHAGDLTEDLEHECYFALLDAIDNYDDSQGFKFLSYAGPCFRGRMQTYLARERGEYVLPAYLLERVRKYKRFVSNFESQYGRRPSGAEIMTACGWSWEEFRNVLAHRNADRVASLDEPLKDEEGAYTLGDTVSGGPDPAEQVEEEIFREQLRRDVWEAVDTLPDQQARAIRMHYQDRRTYQEIGADMGVSIEAGRQVCAKGLRTLRSSRRTRNKLRAYYVDIYGEATRGALSGFLNSRISSTERAALKDLGEWWND